MRKKVSVEIEYTRIMKSVIELPKGKTLDDISYCIGGVGNKPNVDIFFSSDEKPYRRKPNFSLGENDFEESCLVNQGTTTFTDLDNKETIYFGNM